MQGVNDGSKAMALVLHGSLYQVYVSCPFASPEQILPESPKCVHECLDPQDGF